MVPDHSVENAMGSYIYIIVGISIVGILFAIFTVTKLSIETHRRAKRTKEARGCTICGSTSFEDISLEGVETPQEHMPSNEIKHFVRRTCNECGHVWHVEVTTTFTFESDSYSLPDGFYGPPYKYK